MEPRDQETAAGTFEFRLFGGAELHGAGASANRDLLARPKLLAFLAYLELAKPQHFYRRDSLLLLFWPDLDAQHARSSLRNTLSRIRSALGQDVIETRGLEELRLRPAVLSCDVTAFRCAIADGDHERALALYRGELLDGFHVSASAEFEMWLDNTRHALRCEAAAGAHKLMHAARAAGDAATALKWARRRLELLPADEAALRDVMEIAAQAGDRWTALSAYELTARHMAEAYDLEVSDETAKLADTIRRTIERTDGEGSAANAPAKAPATASAASRKIRQRRWLAFVLVMFALALIAVSAVRRDAATPAGSIAHENAPAWIEVQTHGRLVPRVAASLVYDPRMNRGVLFGGRSFETVLGDLWRLHGANGLRTPRWERIATTNIGPGMRWLHAAAYDAKNDRMILFGGSSGYTTPCSNDVWVLPGAMRARPPLTWIKIDASPAPAPRAEMGAAYDALNNRLIVHGGHDCVRPIFSDLWVLTNANGIGASRWIQLSPRAPQGSPGARRNHSVAYDALANRLILYGGRADYGSDGFRNDLWILTHGNGTGGIPEWQPMQAAVRPPPLAFQHAFHDPETNRLLLLGGRSTQQGLSDVRIGEAWILIGAAGAPAAQVWHELRIEEPPALTNFAAAYDPLSNRVILFGGSAGDRASSTLWLLANAIQH